MGQPAAKQGDQITATDTHIVLVPSPSGPVPTPQPFPFVGVIDGGLSSDVMIMGLPAATVGSTAHNVQPHLPTPPATGFQSPPSNRGTTRSGSSSVTINGKPAARNGDAADTCNDPADMPIGTLVAAGTVLIG